MSRGQGGETEHRYPGQSGEVTSVLPTLEQELQQRGDCGHWRVRGWKDSDLDPASKPSPAQSTEEMSDSGKVLLAKTPDVRAGSAEA